MDEVRPDGAYGRWHTLFETTFLERTSCEMVYRLLEGKNILKLVGSLDDRERFAAARRKLRAARGHRVAPGRDDKVLASWNGLLLAAFAKAARALEQDNYRQVTGGLGRRLSRPREIAMVGERGARHQALLETATSGFHPHQVVAMDMPDQEVAAVPLLAGRPAVDGGDAAYVCQGFACQTPVTEPQGLAAMLQPDR